MFALNWNIITTLVSGIEANSRGMDSTATLVSGETQQWILIPTAVRAELNSILCKPLNSKECKTSSKKMKNQNYKNITQWDFNEAWFDQIAPQLINDTWNGRYMVIQIFLFGRVHFAIGKRLVMLPVLYYISLNFIVICFFISANMPTIVNKGVQ